MCSLLISILQSLNTNTKPCYAEFETSLQINFFFRGIQCNFATNSPTKTKQQSIKTNCMSAEIKHKLKKT